MSSPLGIFDWTFSWSSTSLNTVIFVLSVVYGNSAAMAE